MRNFLLLCSIIWVLARLSDESRSLEVGDVIDKDSDVMNTALLIIISVGDVIDKDSGVMSTALLIIISVVMSTALLIIISVVMNTALLIIDVE